MCDVTALAVGGMAVAGAASAASSKKGATSSSSSSSSSAPWAPQQAGLVNAFSDAETLKRQAFDNTYQGPYSAGQNDLQREGANGLVDYARGTGTELARGVGTSAQSLLGSTQGYTSTAANLAANGGGALNGTAAGALTAQAQGQTAAMGQQGLQGQQGVGQAMGNAGSLFGQSQQDLNPSIQQGAAGYVNNDLLNGQIDAANRDVARDFAENTRTGLNARASLGGNLNSSRAGAAEAVAARGAQDRMADTAATMRSNAYNTGINASLTANSQQNALGLGANSQLGSLGTSQSQLGENARQFNTGNQQSAAQTLGQLDLSNRSLDAQTRLGANAQQGNAVGMGMDGASSAGALSFANSQALSQAGGIQQGEAQRVLDENRAQIENPQDRNAQTLQNFYGIVGGNNWGGTSSSAGTQSVQNPSNIVGGALGGASLGMGLVNGGMLGDMGGSAGTAGMLGSLGISNSNASGGALASANPYALPARPSTGYGKYF